MNIEPFRAEDIALFLRLATVENWVAEKWEFDFLLSEFSQGCFTARGEDGQVAGFVTALRHDRSGWIGNLIVSAEYRGQGIGKQLFVKAFEALLSSGVETIWLTASASGKALYVAYGFSCIDTVIRWTGTGRQRHATHDATDEITSAGPFVSGIDCQAWGDRREALLEATVGRGKLLQEETGFTVIQPCGAAHQFGPFTARDSATAERIFDAAHGRILHGSKIYLDAPASNRAALRLFNRKRLRIAGSTELMGSVPRSGRCFFRLSWQHTLLYRMRFPALSPPGRYQGRC
jgi:GNAT superfamily N-acetyltransferase